MRTLLRNLRHAVRALARTPAFTVTVVLTLALGIGANSAVFSAIDAVLLQPLAFPDGDRLVRLAEIHEEATETGVGVLRIEDWDRLSSTFTAITAYATLDASDTTGELPERVRVAAFAPRFLDVWGTEPALGRGFTAAEHRFGGPCVRLISDRYWRNRLGADPDVLNRTISIDNQPCSVVGVMPASFLFPDRDVDLWGPEAIDAPWDARTVFYSYRTGVGRLAPGVTLEQARADLDLVQSQLGEEYPETDRGIRVGITPLKVVVVGGASGTLWLLFGAVSVLLLIACTNIAALLLSRATRREHEIAVRYSLGASRAAVIGQVMTEAAVLACAGAVLGLLVATGAFSAIQRLAPELPRLEEVGIDARLLLYTLVSVVLVTLLCGLIPAFRSARNEMSAFRSGRTQVSSRQSLQWSLVGVQVALSVTLLVGAGLLLRSFGELARIDPGFELDRALTFRMTQVYDQPWDVERARIEGWLDELAALPGVEAAAISYPSPPGVPVESPEFEFERVDGGADADVRIIAEGRAVSPGYFRTMGIPIIAGELCRRQAAGQTGTPVTREVMVNRRFADRYFPGRSAAGLSLSQQLGPEFGGGVSILRIAGITGDARERGLDREPAPTVYACDTVDTNPWYVVRTSGEPGTAIASVREKMRELAPLRSVYPIAPLTERVAGVYEQDWLRTVLLTLFAATALALASLGVYGTLSYVVGLRRREVGLRVALGALHGDIVSQFLRKTLIVVGIACVAGLALSFVLTRALAGMLFGVSPTDPLTLSGVVVVVITVAALAAWLPAMRAARIDPMQTLREE